MTITAEQFKEAARKAAQAGDIPSAKKLIARGMAAEKAGAIDANNARAREASAGTLPPMSQDRLTQQAGIDAQTMAQMQPAPERGIGTVLRENIMGDYDPTTQNFGETVGSMLNKAGEAMTFGLVGDEASAKLESMASGADYGQRRDHYRQQEATFDKNHPVLSVGAQIGGALALPIGAIGAGAKGVKGVAGAVGTGAAAGLTYGFMEGEGGLSNRAKAGGLGAGLGLAGGAAGYGLGKVVSWAGKKLGGPVARMLTDKRMYTPQQGLTDEGKATLVALGYNLDDISEKFASEFGKVADDAVRPADAAAAAQMAEFGIPAYKANISGTADDFAAFERARRGAIGPAAEAKVGAAAERQMSAVRTAGDDIATGLGGGAKGDQWDAAVAVSERLKGISSTEKAAAQAAYDAADAAGVSVPASIAKGVTSRIESRLAASEIDTTLSQMSETRAFMSRLAKRGDGDSAVSLRLIDGLRKDINASLPKAVPEDARALSIIKSEYDNWIDDVVTAKLFSGDEAGIGALKEARGLWSAYAQKFAGKDAGSKFLQDMVDSDASPDQVVKWLFSAGRMGTGKMNASLAGTLKETLGEASDEWGMVRQAAFRQLTEKPEGMTQWGPQKLSENILNFVNSPATRDLSSRIYSGKELAMMRRYAGALKRMVPPAGAVNNSGTAYENARMVRGAFQALGGALGIGVSGGVPGAGVAASGAVSAAQKGSSWLAARGMLKGVERKALPVGGAARAGGVLAGCLTTQQYPNQPQ